MRLSRFAALAALVFAVSPGLWADNATGILVNLSTRIRIAEGGAPAIVGCALNGADTRQLLVRAVGPGLAAFGVGGTLTDPKLTVYDAAGRVVATNDNWEAGGNGAALATAATASGAFGLPAGSRDAAVLVTLPAGSYSVHVAGADNGGGVVLVELYAVSTRGPRLVNLSVRGLAGQGADTLTAGFAIRGTPRTVLMRAAGPALAAFGLTGTLPNPRVRLLDAAQKPLAENGDWGTGNDVAALTTAMTTVGAFGLPAGSLDAAMTTAIEAGTYTMQVSDDGGRTGEALIEVYDVTAFDPYATARTELFRNWSSDGTARPATPKLTHLPMALADLGEIVPMGLMVQEHVTPTDHAYLWGTNKSAASATYAVFVPADGIITTIQHRVSLNGTDVGAREFNDYRVTMEHSGTLFSYYDLLDNIDPAIVAQIPGGIPRGGQVRVRVPVKGGQAIGRIGGKSLDFAVVDLERPNTGFVVPDHYLSESWKLFTVDPFDAFTDTVRAQLLTKVIGDQNPRGGRIAYDQSGRLVGTWFREGTNGYRGNNDPRGYWVGHLSVVYHCMDTRTIIVSLGTFGTQGARQFAVKGNAPAPESVTIATGVVKYELVGLNRIDGPTPLLGANPAVLGTVLFQVLEDDRLRVEVFPGQTAAQVAGFTAAALVYER